jgi:hypothetical protein
MVYNWDFWTLFLLRNSKYLENRTFWKLDLFLQVWEVGTFSAESLRSNLTGHPYLERFVSRGCLVRCLSIRMYCCNLCYRVSPNAIRHECIKLQKCTFVSDLVAQASSVKEC